MVPYTSIPILSATFLIVIGVLIGHLLFYRYRDKDDESESTSAQGSADRTPNHPTESGLDLMMPQHFAEMKSKFENRENELRAIKAAHASLESQWHQLRTDHDRLTAELTKATHALDETKSELSSERHRNSELKSSLVDADSHAERSRQSADALQTVRKEYQVKIQAEQQKALELSDQISKRDAELRQANAKVIELGKKLESAMQNAEAHQDSNASEMRKEFDAKLDEQLQQVNELASQLKERDHQLATAESRISKLQDEIDTNDVDSRTLQQEQETYANKLAAAKDQQRAVEAKLASVTAAFSEAKLEIEQLVASQDGQSDAQNEVKRLQQKIQELSVAGQDAAKKIGETERQLEQALATRDEQESIINDLNVKVEELTASLQNERLNGEKLAQAAADRAGEFDKLQRESDELLLLRESHPRMQATIDNLQKRMATMEADRSEAIENASGAERQIEQLSSTIHRQQEELQALAMQSNGMAQQLDDARQSIEQAESNANKYQAELTQHAEASAKLEASLAERDSEIAKQTETLNELRDVQVRITTVEQAHQHRLALTTQQRDSAMRRAEGAESELNGIRERLTEENGTLQQLRTELQSTVENLDAERARAAQFEHEVDVNAEEIRHLRDEMSRIELSSRNHGQLADQLADVTSRLALTAKQRDEAIMAEQSTRAIISELRNELTERLEAVEALRQDKDDTVARLASERRAKQALERQVKQSTQDTDAELKSLRAQQQANEQTIRNLHRQRTELLAAQKNESAKQFVSLSMFKGLSSSVEGFDEPDKTRYDEQLGVLYKKKPARRDDLKLITGVAGVLERKLNKIGVYKYQQIMQWDDIAVEEFSKLLSFRDRIQRDNWIGQARRLYRQHYERRAA